MAYVNVNAMRRFHINAPTERQNTMHTGVSEHGKTFLNGVDEKKRAREAESDAEVDIAVRAKKPRHAPSFARGDQFCDNGNSTWPAMAKEIMEGLQKALAAHTPDNSKRRLNAGIVFYNRKQSEKGDVGWFKKRFYRAIADYGVDRILAWENEEYGLASMLHAAVHFDNVFAHGPDPWVVSRLIEMGADVNGRPTGTAEFLELHADHTPLEKCASALGKALVRGAHTSLTPSKQRAIIANYYSVITILREADEDIETSIEDIDTSIGCMWEAFRSATFNYAKVDENDDDGMKYLNEQIIQQKHKIEADPSFFEAFGLPPPQHQLQFQPALL